MPFLSTPERWPPKSGEPRSIPVVFYDRCRDRGSNGSWTCQPASRGRRRQSTRVTSLSVDQGKRLELVHELLPKVNIIALLVNPTSPLAQTEIKDEQAAAEKLGLELHVLQASTERDFDEVFADVAKLRAGALVIGPDSLFTNRQKDLAAMALRHSVPAIYQFHAFAAAGGLMVNTDAINGIFTGRILKGEAEPTCRPVQQIHQGRAFFTINLKDAPQMHSVSPCRSRC